jgi:uracil-DNA glycosylase
VDLWARLEHDVIQCERCPRLREHSASVARVKRRAFRDETYWGKPVPSFGDARARIVFVGLAPAAHGANRTGRMFTGDDSGRWLYGALHRAGMASHADSETALDGLVLTGAFVTAACRCAPPDNKPTPQERAACAPFLDREFDLLANTRVVVALGGIAWDAVLRRVLRLPGGFLPRPRPRFGHGAELEVTVRAGSPPVVLLGSYHPSRQNTNTGRLTRRMLDAVLGRARAIAQL